MVTNANITYFFDSIMENPEENTSEKPNGFTKGIVKEIQRICMVWPDNITTIDLSNQKLSNIDENVKLPLRLDTLNLSHNNLQIVPDAVINHPNLKYLDISFNKIELFDDTPESCHTIEYLNMANNNLLGPPYWVWSATPKLLTHLNLSNNIKISESFKQGYFEELLMYNTIVKHVTIYNCRLGQFKEIFGTFSRATRLEIGAPDFSCFLANFIDNIPCPGLDKCCDTEILNLSNLKIYTINTTIDIYKNLIEINLAMNNISDLPREFCNLENLEVCILSQNNLLCLPEEMDKLRKLKHLHVDNNDLCMVPESLGSLPELMTLDLYNNNCYEVPEDVWKTAEIDAAQNYFDEPENLDYLEKKEKLRLKLPVEKRMDGKKPEPNIPESEDLRSSDDEEFLSSIHSDEGEQRDKLAPSSSEEDWSADEYWIPSGISKPTPMACAWTHYVKKKMEEGNFCPMDLHTVPVYQKVKYEKLCNPKVHYDVEGQFDVTDEDS